MDQTLCGSCKEQLAVNLTLGFNKRQKLDNPMNAGFKSGTPQK